MIGMEGGGVVAFSAIIKRFLSSGCYGWLRACKWEASILTIFAFAACVPVNQVQCKRERARARTNVV